MPRRSIRNPRVLGGWVATPDYYANKKDVLSRINRAWVEANDYMVRNPAAAAEALHNNHYKQAALSDVTEAFKAQKLFSLRETEATVSGRRGREMAAAGQ
jgi:NitT/TauT family transport system substrate-binding protein